MSTQIRWIITTAEKFNALETKNENALYFISDTQEIFKGSILYSQPTVLVDEFPVTGAQGRIYILKSNLEGKIWSGTEWKPVIEPVVTTLIDKVNQIGTASAESVKSYVLGKVQENLNTVKSNLKYNEKDKAIEFSYLDAEGEEQKSASNITGFLEGVTYNGETGVLAFKNRGLADVEINLPKDNFVNSGKYDPDKKEIVLTLVGGEEVKIPASDLVDIYTGKDSTTATTTVSENNEISVDLKISKEVGNSLEVKSDGLFVNLKDVDLTGKLDKVEKEKADELIVSNTDGSVKTSGVKLDTLATTQSVSDIKTALEKSIGLKLEKTSISTVMPISLENASDEKVLSEKAILTALSWEQL